MKVLCDTRPFNGCSRQAAFLFLKFGNWVPSRLLSRSLFAMLFPDLGSPRALEPFLPIPR